MLVNLLTNPAVVLLHTLFPAVWITAALEAAAVGRRASTTAASARTSRRPWALAWRRIYVLLGRRSAESAFLAANQYCKEETKMKKRPFVCCARSSAAPPC